MMNERIATPLADLPSFQAAEHMFHLTILQ